MALRPTRERDEGLASLLADVLRPDGSDEELLLRYADAAATLSADERARIELALERSPALRDQLRVLRELDLDAALASAGARIQPAQRAEAAPSAWRRVRALLRPRLTVVAVPLAAAALLAIALLRSGAPELRVPTEPAPGPIAKATRPPEPAAPTTLPEDPPARIPAEPEPQPVEVAKAPAPRAEPKPEAKPAPELKPAPAEPQLDYLAMAEPVYRAPFDAAALEDEQTFIRGAAGVPTLAALAPRHVARTVAARPILLWYLSALPDGALGYVLTIANDEDTEPLVQRPLPAPARPGLQRIALADLGVELPAGKALRWSVALRIDPDNPSRDVIAQGAIERVAESADLGARLDAAKPLDRPSVYAAAGLWYDALAELERIARSAPDPAVPRARLRQLLESGGIPDAQVIAP